MPENGTCFGLLSRPAVLSTTSREDENAKTAPVSVVPKEDLPDLTPAQLERQFQGWVLDGEISQFSPRTIEERKRVLGKLLWFLKDRELYHCGLNELRAFLVYLGRAHELPEGW